MKPSSCLHPIRIYNKALGTYINVPCGHCDACNVIKGYRRAEKINAAFNSYFYRFFVTCTYRDECLPLACYDNETGCLVSDDCDYNGELYHVSVSSEVVLKCQDFILSRVQKYGGVPVLSHSDCINFKKRFRKYAKQKLGYYPEVFISSTGEYGPLHFRPHFHYLFGFNDPKLFPIFRECVFDAWRMFDKYSSETDLRLIGKTDIQQVVGKGCANYCASYVNCMSALPLVLQRTAFRQFHSSSRTGDFQLERSQSTDIKQIYERLPITETIVDSETISYSTNLVSELFKNRYFPKCGEFSRLSHYDRVSLYRTYEQYCALTADEFARKMIDVRLHGYFYIPTNLDRLLNLYYINVFYNDDGSVNLDSLEKCVVKLKRLYYVSRRVCYNSFACGVTVSDYVSRIEQFYDKLALDQLRRFYQSINDMMDDVYIPLPLSKVFSLYYNTSTDIHNFAYYQEQFGVGHLLTFDCYDIQQQSQYAEKMHKIAVDNTKTKKRNDDFITKGITHTPYVPLLTHNKKEFLNFWTK